MIDTKNKLDDEQMEKVSGEDMDKVIPQENGQGGFLQQEENKDQN